MRTFSIETSIEYSKEAAVAAAGFNSSAELCNLILLTAQLHFSAVEHSTNAHLDDTVGTDVTCVSYESSSGPMLANASYLMAPRGKLPHRQVARTRQLLQ